VLMDQRPPYHQALAPCGRSAGGLGRPLGRDSIGCTDHGEHHKLRNAVKEIRCKRWDTLKKAGKVVRAVAPLWRLALPHPPPAGAQRCAASAAALCSRHGRAAPWSADRSAQRLIPRRRWAAPAAGWVARHLWINLKNDTITL
jgi:hypothetical protein